MGEAKHSTWLWVLPLRGGKNPCVSNDLRGSALWWGVLPRCVEAVSDLSVLQNPRALENDRFNPRSQVEVVHDEPESA